MDIFNTHFELQESDAEIAILPVASIEQHSRHLPLGTDSIIAWHISKKISKALSERGYMNYLLPPQPFATSLEHKGFKGTVTLKPPTLALVVKDIIHCLYEHGFLYVIVLNFHGGNFILKPTVREINYDNPGKKVILVEDSGIIPEDEIKQIFETGGIHSGESETSVMLAIDERYVRDERIDVIPDFPRNTLDMYSMKHLSPEGVWGIPSKATKEKGERFIQLMVEYGVKTIELWIKRCRENADY